MAIKTKTAKRTAKKISPISTPEINSLPAGHNLLNASALLDNKRRLSMIIGIGVLALIIVLAVLFKSIFIAAMVNGEPISRLSVINSLEKQGGKKTLDNLIIKQLILQEAKKRNIQISQNEIDAEIKKITANLQAQGSTLDQVLISQGMTRSDLNDEIKIQVTLNKIIGEASVTEKEIDDFVTANKGQMAAGTTEAQFRGQAILALKQQKTQIKTQEFIKNLQDKANVSRFVSY